MANIDGSLLPSTPRASERIFAHDNGVLRVVPSPELDTHFVTLRTRILAEHPNGYSCAELAHRIVKAWDAPSPDANRRVLDQVEYIVACGGMAKPLQAFEDILNTRTKV